MVDGRNITRELWGASNAYRETYTKWYEKNGHILHPESLVIPCFSWDLSAVKSFDETGCSLFTSDSKNQNISPILTMTDGVPAPRKGTGAERWVIEKLVHFFDTDIDGLVERVKDLGHPPIDLVPGSSYAQQMQRQYERGAERLIKALRADTELLSSIR